MADDTSDTQDLPSAGAIRTPVNCSTCGKEQGLCLCREYPPIQTATEVLILQHPQELDRELGTARLAHALLPRSTFLAALSRRNLKAALGREVPPKEWLVLYLGSFRPPQGRRAEPELLVLNRKGAPHPDSSTILSSVKGLVVLDGTWSQAKALWWRNPWLLKLNRGVLIPARPSRYGNLRKEPRREGLSTIESIGQALTVLEGRPEIAEKLDQVFAEMLRRYRALKGIRGR